MGKKLRPGDTWPGKMAPEDGTTSTLPNAAVAAVEITLAFPQIPVGVNLLLFS